MRKAASVLILLSLVAFPFGGAVAQEKKAADKAAAALDAAKLERFLRRYFAWPDAVKVSIGPFKPSPVAGLVETAVKISHEGQQQETTFLVSADGQYLLQGQPQNLNADPFAGNRAKIQLKDAPSLGSPLAPVTIVEYADFQCSFCKATATVLKDQVLKQFSTDVRVVYKDFPLVQIHPWAMPAAALGRCIHKRYADSFWPYHDWAFANQSQLTVENFKQKALAFAKEKGLDADQLGACMEQPDTRAEVDHALAEGQSLGISGTPTLFINGRRLVGSQSFAQLRQVIQTELDYARGK